MSTKNRTVVKDGRLQVKKKRTDRSYLQPQAQPETDAQEAPEDLVEDVATPAQDEASTSTSEVTAPEVAAPDESVQAPPPPPPAPLPTPAVAAPAAVATAPAAPRGGAARALQQQGVRKRREIDVNELARRDSKYAMHELRRIAILTALVVVTLVVLAFVLR